MADLTPDQLAQQLGVTAAALEREFGATIRGVAVSALAFTKKLMTEQIYAIPEDRTRKGEARFQTALGSGKRFQARKGDRKWVRTGHLRRSEKFEIRGPYQVDIVNTAAYAEPRHEAGKPGRRKINPLRASHWRDELVETFGPIMLDLYSQTIEAILAGKKR